MGCRTNSKIGINQDCLFSALLQIPEIYTSKPSVHRNGATARGSNLLRVTKIVAVYQTVCLVLIEDSPIEKEKMHFYSKNIQEILICVPKS